LKAENRLIDLSYLEIISDGDPTFKKEIIETFIRNAPLQMKDMTEAAENEKWKIAGDIAHSMKPSFTLLGMENKKEIVLGIEHAGRNNDNVQNLPGLIKKLNELINHVIIELQEELNKIS
jgi:HPt (histidine-containing phosphotransfer) domain-containing protein